MASTAAPFGLRPIGLTGGTPFAGAVREIPIATTYGTAIFTGDVVKVVAGGTVEKDTETATLTPIGVFMGCAYTDPTSGQYVNSAQWPASNAATDAVAFVADNPDLEMLIQADEAVAATAIGANAAIVQTAGSTAIGQSKNALDGGSVATTSTLPLRIVGFWKGPLSAVGDTYTDVIVRWNAGHQHKTAAGI